MPTPPKKPIRKSASSTAKPNLAKANFAKANFAPKPSLTTTTKPAAKAFTAGSDAAKKATAAATETMNKATKQNAENVVRISDSARGMMERGAEQARAGQAQASQFAKQSSEKMNQAAGAASRGMSEMGNLGQRQMEAMMECGNIAARMSKEMSEDMFAYMNESFSSNVEISKDIFTCRTINDVFDLQNKMMNANLESLFAQTTKMSEMMFNFFSQTSEPLQECMQEASERIGRTMAAA